MQVYKLPQQTSQYRQVSLPATGTIRNAAEYLIVQRMISVAKGDAGRLTVHVILEEPVSSRFIHNLNQHRVSQPPAGGISRIKWRAGTEGMEWPLLPDCLFPGSCLPAHAPLGPLLCSGHAVFWRNPTHLQLQLPSTCPCGAIFTFSFAVVSPGMPHLNECSAGKQNSPHHQIQITPSPHLLFPSTQRLAAPSTHRPTRRQE